MTVSETDPVPALNRMLRTLYRSLPMYLRDARPWAQPGQEQFQAVLTGMAADHRAWCNRLADAVREHGGALDLGHFAMEFTDLHDLSAEFLVRRLVDLQTQDLKSLRSATGRLPPATPERLLADEIVAGSQRHLETLGRIANC